MKNHPIPKFKLNGHAKAAESPFQSPLGKRATLATIKAEFMRHYYYSDTDVIDVVLGIVAGNHFDSDPCWLHLISAPSSGKTELLRSTETCNETYFLSDFTPNTFISGYKEDGKASHKDGMTENVIAEEKEYSLLPELDGKVLITKDFSVIHDKPHEKRSQIVAILRDAYDGFCSRAFGNMPTKGFHSRFNYLTGMTPDIEKLWSLNTLGERFLMFRIQIADRREHARASMANQKDAEKVRQGLQEKVKAFIAGLPKDVVPDFDEKMQEQIIDLADLLTTCRTYVERDKNGNLLFKPQPELAPRVTNQLLRIGRSLALVRGKRSLTNDEFRVMKRIAMDSLPANRKLVLQALWSLRKAPAPIEAFENATGFKKTTVRRLLEDLAELGVVDVTSETKKTKPVALYCMVEAFRQYCKNVGGLAGAEEIKPHLAPKGIPL